MKGYWLNAENGLKITICPREEKGEQINVLNQKGNMSAIVSSDGGVYALRQRADINIQFV